MTETLDSTPKRPDRGRFDFQHRWFDKVLPEWERRTSTLRGRKLRILEVGSFEGGSTTWILDNLMSHPQSTLTAIDTFGGSIEHEDHPSIDYDISSLEKRFWSNVSKCAEVKKLNVIKQLSEDALIKLRHDGARFDFIYIDASHVALDVLQDAVISWKMLDTGGTMVFDDYTWMRYKEDCYNPRIAIDALLHCAAPEVQASQAVTQMWTTKVPTHIQPTLNPDRDLMYWGTKAWCEEDKAEGKET